MIKKDERIGFKIEANTKKEFKKALKLFSQTISENLVEHIKKENKRAERIRKNPRLTTD